MVTERVSIPVEDKDRVSGKISVPEGHLPGRGTGVILAHGEGNDMDHPLIVTLSLGLAEAGYLALRFNFPYREKGRRAPDAQNTLVLAWQSAYRFLKGHSWYGTETVVAAGKSMGGRVASQMVAEGLLGAQGLVFLGYPLHPPGRKGQLRDVHLYRINIPMLFFAGTRDPLCDLAALKGVLERLDASWKMEPIEGGNHSFQVPKSAGIAQEEVYKRILNTTVEWLGTYAERR